MILCPACGGRTGVVDSRSSGEAIRRRRRCLARGCGRRLTTYEISGASMSALVGVRVALVDGRIGFEAELVPESIRVAPIESSPPPRRRRR